MTTPAPPDPNASKTSASPRTSDPAARKAYWRANMKLIAILLSVWAVVSFGCSILFVEQLNQFKFFNVPLGFWFAQQGSIYVFTIMIFIYAWRMDVLDRRFGVQE